MHTNYTYRSMTLYLRSLHTSALRLTVALRQVNASSARSLHGALLLEEWCGLKPGDLLSTDDVLYRLEHWWDAPLYVLVVLNPDSHPDAHPAAGWTRRQLDATHAYYHRGIGNYDLYRHRSTHE